MGEWKPPYGQETLTLGQPSPKGKRNGLNHPRINLTGTDFRMNLGTRHLGGLDQAVRVIWTNQTVVPSQV
jgi:hypothetical protein